MSLMAAAVTIMAASTAVSALSAIQQGRYQRKVSQYNARVAENKKVAIQQKAELDVQRHRETVKRLKGSQRVAYASSGVDLSGSALDIISDTERRGLLDEKIIKYNAAQAISGAESEMALNIAEGEQGYQSGLISAGTSLLAGAGQFINIKNQQKKGLI